MSEERVLTHREPAFMAGDELILKQNIEWRKDGRVIRKGHRLIREDGRLYKTITLRYEEVPA